MGGMKGSIIQSREILLFFLVLFVMVVLFIIIMEIL
jgi:hypothetical protein